jgi:hypothetical protein
MTNEQKLLWKVCVKSRTPKGYFHLPLQPKGIDEMTDEEFELLDSSDWYMITEDFEFFVCKKMEDNV